MVMWVGWKRSFRPEDLFRGFAIMLLLFTPLVGGYWWWSLIVVAVIIALTLIHILRRRTRQIDRYMVT
jgi:hypothetical protein